jgi:hypothetical protein
MPRKTARQRDLFITGLYSSRQLAFNTRDLAIHIPFDTSLHPAASLYQYTHIHRTEIIVDDSSVANDPTQPQINL